MKIEMGESLFYSWLRHVKECQIVQTNWKTSSKWFLQNEEKLNIIKNESDKFFKEKYGYSIYKGTSSLSQLLQQAECDVIGISVNGEGKDEICAIDVAFHEAGLNYGDSDTTIMKVINKSLRTAMCIFGYLGIKSANIIFASPKINRSIMDKLELCIKDIQELMDRLGYQFKFELIANSDFLNRVLNPMLEASDEVADTSELFLRSYQMLQMFNNVSYKEKLDTNINNNKQNYNYKDLKIGKLAQIMIRKIIENNNISQNEINNLLDKEYSKRVFNINYPVLVKEDGDYDKYRYYNEPINFDGKNYLLCNMWFEKPQNNSRPYLEKWIEENKGK
ncbi:MAG: hypothetical protein IJ790_02215 [Lachnospiraceae bacterium]|nr:hypothetical protein [Lachnospiraceae bacterium]